MRRFVVIWLLIIAAVLCGGMLAKSQFSDSGIVGLRTLEDALAKKIGVHYTVDEEYYESMITYPEQFQKYAEEASVIVAGRSTGRLIQHSELFGQEIVVTEVKKGDAHLRGKKVYVYQFGGFQMFEGRLRYYGGLSVMKPETTYLCFLSPTTWDMMFDEKGYALVGGLFSYLNMEKQNDSFVISPGDDFAKMWQSEFLSGSQKIIDQMNIVKEALIQDYDSEGIH